MSQTTGNKRKLKELLEEIPENKKPIAQKLLDRINFMDKTLNDLQRQIRREGAVIEAKNGNGFTTISEHPAQKSYNTMIGRYNALVKTFCDLIPAGDMSDDAFTSFIKGGKK